MSRSSDAVSAEIDLLNSDATTISDNELLHHYEFAKRQSSRALFELEDSLRHQDHD